MFKNIRPQCCKSRILEDLTDIVILGLTITLSYRGIRDGAFSIRPKRNETTQFKV